MLESASAFLGSETGLYVSGLCFDGLVSVEVIEEGDDFEDLESGLCETLSQHVERGTDTRWQFCVKPFE